MANKQTYTFRDAGGKFEGTAATLASVTDAIKFKDNTSWLLNMWITGLTFAGKAPTVTVEVANTTTATAFTPLTGAIDITIDSEIVIKSEFAKWKFFRINYDPQGASAGTKNAILSQLE